MSVGSSPARTGAPLPLVDEVPREGFIPDRIWVFDRERGGHVAVDKANDPGRWHAELDTDEPVVTQLDDAPYDPLVTRVAPRAPVSSSSSKPSIMAGMLDALDVRPGHRVLEIGTGTGWNAALLAHRAGLDGDVTSVEVDPGIADAARGALERGGHRVRVVCGDGLTGAAEYGPYDRIISTAGIVEIVPPAWLDQLAPGGRLVTPWTTAWGGGVQLTLDRGEDDTDTAVGIGWFSGNLVFMPIRSQRTPLWAREVTDEDLADAEVRTTECRSEDFDRMFDPAVGKFGVGAQLSGIVLDIRWGPDEPTDALVDLDDPVTGSFARITGDFGDPTPFVVHQLGPRRLWDEAEAAYDRWWEQREPAPNRYGLTVTATEQTLWLDTPDNPVRTWA